MTGLIDLDAVAAPDVHVQLGGQKYRLPGDPPTELLLNIAVLSDRVDEAMRSVETDPEAARDLRAELGEAIEDLFRERQPNLEEGSIKLSERQIANLIDALFEHYTPKDEGGDRPTPEETPPKPRNSRPSARSSTASGSRTRTRSRSSTSSPT